MEDYVTQEPQIPKYPNMQEQFKLRRTVTKDDIIFEDASEEDRIMTTNINNL